MKRAQAHAAAQGAATAALPHFFMTSRQLEGAFLPPMALAQTVQPAQQQLPVPAAGLDLTQLSVLSLLQASHQGLTSVANDAAMAAAFGAALLSASAAIAAVPAAPAAAPAPRPVELEHFVSEFLLEPSLEVEELGLGVSDPMALPPILLLPEQQGR